MNFIKKLRFLLLAAILLAGAMLSLTPAINAQGGKQYYVDAQNGNDSANGSFDAPWKSLAKVSSFEFSAGDRIKFKRGATWNGEFLFISASGNAGAPIVFEAYGNGNNPKILNGGIIITGAQHIQLKNFETSHNAYAGIVLQGGAQHIEISNNILHHNSAGIWTGNNAGMNNVISGNLVYLNEGNGIAVDAVFCTSGNETVIAHNKIYSNTWHGIELSGNYHIVDGNTVYNNGANPDGSDDMIGHSGIHLFSRFHLTETNRGGSHNIIRNNLVYATKDRNDGATDGNGIQMDMWCDDNLVYNNIAWQNDGPGVISFGGSNNKIVHNTLYNNGLHRQGSGRLASTQIMIASSDEVTAANNLLANNIAYAVYTNSYALFIEQDAISRSNVFSANLLFNAENGNLIGLGYTGKISLETWNATNWAEDLQGNPLFINAAQNNFHLHPASPAANAGITVTWLTTDIEGNPRPCFAYDIGAYEACRQLYLPLILKTAG